jgi:DNA-binding response OmpR family regulator
VLRAARAARLAAVESRILLIEDDSTIGEVLTSSLRAQGYDVSWHRSGVEGLERAAATGTDLVLLDLGLPDLDGVEVCRRLRCSQPDCVLIILTARATEMDVVLGLDAGADDYLVKPVRLAELQARIRAHLRRNLVSPTRRELPPIGDMVVDLPRRRVMIAGREVPLRPKEFDLLARFAADPDVALSRETLMADVWDEHWFGSTKTLDVHVGTLRHKIGQIAGSTSADVPEIVTLRGYGYRMVLHGDS